MITKWYHPSWCGDFRLEADGESSCVLRVKDPTLNELEQLGRFLEKCRAKKYVEKYVGIIGSCDILIGAPVAEAGILLLSRGRRRAGIITTVVSSGGEVKALLGEPEPRAVEALAEPAEEKLEPVQAEVVTTRRPTLSCPVPVSGPDIRASEVLHAFSSERQRETWEDQGLLYCYGKYSGHKYRIAHRHSDLARRQGKVCFDVDDNVVIHAYDWSVPPAEEVLAIKLALEHAEHWVRNPSGTLRLGGADIYCNPFASEKDQWRDGVPDTMVLSGIAGAIVGAVGVEL